MLGGYPRAESPVPRASSTPAGGGSHGVPIDTSIAPPSWASAMAAISSSRSYGYGGGTKGVVAVMVVLRRDRFLGRLGGRRAVGRGAGRACRPVARAGSGR